MIKPKLLSDIDTYQSGIFYNLCDCGANALVECAGCREECCEECCDEEGYCLECCVYEAGDCVALPGETMPWDQ